MDRQGVIMILQGLRKVLVDISTGIDGKTFCWARVSGHLAVVSYIGLSVSDFVVSHQFNPIAFGTGFGALIGSVGGAIWAKRDTEPT